MHSHWDLMLRTENSDVDSHSRRKEIVVMQSTRHRSRFLIRFLDSCEFVSA